MPLDLTDDRSTLVQVMAWCHQATSHYLTNVDPDLCRHMASLGLNELICSYNNICRQHKCICSLTLPCLNIMAGWHFEDDIFKCVSIKENICILIHISMHFVHNGPTDNHKSWHQHWLTHCGLMVPYAVLKKSRKFAMPETSENWLGFVNSCIYSACHILEINQTLPYLVDFKAPRQLWNK